MILRTLAKVRGFQNLGRIAYCYLRIPYCVLPMADYALQRLLSAQNDDYAHVSYCVGMYI